MVGGTRETVSLLWKHKCDCCQQVHEHSYVGLPVGWTSVNFGKQRTKDRTYEVLDDEYCCECWPKIEEFIGELKKQFQGATVKSG